VLFFYGKAWGRGMVESIVYWVPALFERAPGALPFEKQRMLSLWWVQCSAILIKKRLLFTQAMFSCAKNVTKFCSKKNTLIKYCGSDVKNKINEKCVGLRAKCKQSYPDK
jgi:hypothetical protein